MTSRSTSRPASMLRPTPIPSTTCARPHWISTRSTAMVLRLTRSCMRFPRSSPRRRSSSSWEATSRGNGGPAGASGTPAGMQTLIRLRRATHPQRREPGRIDAHGRHRRSPERRKSHRVPVPSRHVALSQPRGRLARRGRVHRRHLCRGTTDRHTSLPVGGRERFSRASLQPGRHQCGHRVRLAPIGSPLRMPVEFAVAAYRFGHSMIRDNYWVNFKFHNATLGEVFQFIRNPQAASPVDLGRRFQRVLRHWLRRPGQQQGAQDRQRARERARVPARIQRA